ncbi:unnamed protein product [Caenorhabditis auriculariae]|uniref:Uncharacterized protein n=1 Tax=Caenorhabditis auriculariae TaxID=2777116 RepID=A0A8S1H644_9PELO|nr:unnamed protein product [Caenorhabditis auriculariae]
MTTSSAVDVLQQEEGRGGHVRRRQKNKPPVPPKRSLFSFGKNGSRDSESSHGSSDVTVIPAHRNENGSGDHEGRPHALTSSSIDSSASTQWNIDVRKAEVLTKPLPSPKEFDIQGLALPALAAVQVYVRKLTLRKNMTGDFGFSIRRVQFPYGNRGAMRTVVFAEPSDYRSGPPRPDDLRNGLLPGDQLLEIDGQRVDKMSRDELQDAVRRAGATIELVVKAVPELAELCQKKVGGVRDSGDQLLLPNVNTSLREDIPEEERFWLLHKGGYTMARMQRMLDDGRATILVAGKTMTVDSTDIDRANPTALDRVGDIASLMYLNETSAVHLLRNRFGSNLLYTNAGTQSVVAMTSPEPTSSERLVSLFKGCRRGQMPAHLYATAQQVYRNLQMTGQNQNIVLTGVTGSGKSTQLRALAQYLSAVAGWTKTLTYDKLSLVFGVLEAFGHASTRFHRDSSRFVQMFALGFDKAAALRAGRVQACMLEAERTMTRSTDEESNFHVFYYLMHGADAETRQRLQLDSIESSTIRLYKNEEQQLGAKEAWERLTMAMAEIGMDESKQYAARNVLGAILHLQAAGSTPGSAQRAHFLRSSHAQVAAELLGVTSEALAQAVFRGKIVGGGASTTTGTAINRFALTSRGCDGPEALNAFGAALYQELFQNIVEHVNRALSSNSACSWISVLDYPGSTFVPSWAGDRPCGLNDLVMNYVNERISELFYDISFVEPQEVYAQEQVDVHIDVPLSSPHPLNRLLDEKQHLLTSTDIEKRSEERRGLFAILDEESMFPGASDDSLFERIFVHLGQETNMIRRAGKPRQFVLAHVHDCQPTTYDISGWLKLAQPCESSAAARPLLANSSNSAIATLFANVSLAGGDSSRLRRATQAAQLELSARRAAGGFIANLNGQIDYVFSSLRRARRSHFVHCVQPQPPSPKSTMTSAVQHHDIVDVPMIRNQLRSISLIDAVRANNRGFPERVSFRDFRRRFGCLAEDESRSNINDTLDDRAAVAGIMERMDIHDQRFRLGISQVLLASDVLNELEDRRELCLSGLIGCFQMECRRHLAAKWLQKRRVLDTAIRCIQKNGQSYLKVREWPWWKLYTRVVPLLAVARSGTESREWNERVRQLEQQIHDLRIAKTKADGRAAELEEELDRQTQTAAQLSVALENESQHKAQIERRLQQWKENGGDNISRVSSSAKLESSASDEKITELRAELQKTRENEEQLRVKTQRSVAQLQDVEGELVKIRARNEILEKKQQRFDADVRVVAEQLQDVKSDKERIEKERDEHSSAVARKVAEIQTLKSENADLRVSVSKLKRDAEERAEKSASQGSVAGEDLASLQLIRRNLETRIRELEDELDDMAGTNQLQAQNVTRLEMGQERLRTELHRESISREGEIDELRGQYQRRLRALEDQLADAQESNSSLIKENRVLEARVTQSHSSYNTVDISGGQAKRELRRVMALLQDTQSLLAHERETAPSQSLIRQLREQLEDAEAAKLSAQKGRHGLESELNEVRAQLEQALVAKNVAEEKAISLLKEKNACGALIVEKDEQLQSLLKKYKAAVQQNQIDHITIADHLEQIADLEKSKQKLAENLHEQTSQNEYLHQSTVERHKLLLSEQKARELEARLDLESAHKLRLESIVTKLTEEVDALQDQMGEANTSRDKEVEAARKIRKEMLQVMESLEEYKKREVDSAHKLRVLRSELQQLEEKNKVSATELKMANRRIESLLAALNEGLGEDSDLDDEIDEERAGMNIL